MKRPKKVRILLCYVFMINMMCLSAKRINDGEKYRIHSEHLVLYNYININVVIHFLLRTKVKQSLIKHSTSRQSPPPPPPNHRQWMQKFPTTQNFFFINTRFSSHNYKEYLQFKVRRSQNCAWLLLCTNAQRIVLYRNMKSFDYYSLYWSFL